VFAGALGKVACCDGLWWLTVVVYGISCWVALLQQNFESTAVDTRVSFTEKRLVSNYVHITIMSDSKQHQ
jgi:hypothetical protein